MKNNFPFALLPGLRTGRETKILVIACLLLILILAGFFRIWQLDTIPPGLYPDEAINGNEAVSNPGQIFYPENNGREGLYINLLSLSFWIFGISIWSIRIVSAVLGIITVMGIYLLAKELLQATSYKLQATRIALLSSFFLTISFWHINFSRIGFRAILVPLILTFAFYFLFKGFRTQKIKCFIFSGIIFGLGFYTYIAFRLAIILLGVVLILWWLIYKKKNLQKLFLLYTLYFLLSTVIIALPIGIYFSQNPEYFVSRAAGISVFSQENPLGALGESLIRHFGMFNFSGDPNWRHNFSGAPLLFWPLGILFLIGFIITLKNLIADLRNEEELTFHIPCFLLSWFLVMLLPGVLTYDGIPHALRTIGVVPVVYIFAGWGGMIVYQWLSKIMKNKKVLILLWMVLLFSIGFAQFQEYFLCWAKNPEVKDAFSRDYVKIGNYLNGLGPEIQKYVVVNQPGVPVPYPDGIPMPAQTPMFVERTKFGKPRATYLLPENLDKIEIGDEKTTILPMQFDENLILRLWQKFPEGKIENENGVWIYKVNF